MAGAILGTAVGDVYMHNPRGSNDRNCERNVNRNNGNRMFDSQNNAKGGYACPRRVAGGEEDDQTPQMYYVEGSTLAVEWTNQHGCGSNAKVNCEVVLQYACEDTLDPEPAADGSLDVGVIAATRAAARPFRTATNVAAPRDGVPQDRDDAATDTIPVDENDAVPNTVARRRYGMHESVDFYNACQRTARNAGLFTADQRVRRRDATGTRQNPNGNRNGLECPEERDYYPYWGPTPWIDVAVLTNNVDRCAFYEAASQNQVNGAVGFCKAPDQATLEGTQEYQQRRWPNNPTDCAAVDAAGVEWVEMPSKATWLAGKAVVNNVVCEQTGESRPNHLGNAQTYVETRDGLGFTDASEQLPATNTANRFLWTIPEHANDACVLRLRYNISTSDYEAWGTDQAGDDATQLTAADNGDNSPIQQDPYVAISETDESKFLSLAVNTNQYGRTFQDRSYVFAIKSRTELGIAANANVYNLNTRGKRGNIVQTYPAVEYDFIPNDLRVAPDDIVHFQWTGSDYNPRRGCNNGEGGPPDDNDQVSAANAAQNSRADRQNIIEMSDMANNWPKAAADLGTGSMFDDATRDSLAFLNQEDDVAALGVTCLTEDELENINNQNERENHPRNCAKLNAKRHPYFDGGLVSMSTAGDFPYFSSRNNNFSNRDETGYICVNSDVSNCAKPTTQDSGPTGTGSGFEEVTDDDIISGDTIAFQEMDNDALGDGNADGCTELSWFPISGVTTEQAVGIAIVTLFAGMVFAVVCYKGYQRYRNPDSDGKGSKFKSKDPKSWQRPKENEMI